MKMIAEKQHVISGKSKKYIATFFLTLGILLSFTLIVSQKNFFTVMAETMTSPSALQQDKQVDNLASPSNDIIEDRHIAADNGKNVYYSWFEDIIPSGGRIMFRRSGDYGKSFTTEPYQVPSTNTNYSFSNLQMCSTNKGNIYLIWEQTLDFRGDSYLRFNSSSDYGVTWNPKDQIIGHTSISDGHYYAQVLCDDNGHINVVYMKHDAGNHIYAFNSSDYGKTWSDHDSMIDHNEGIDTPLVAQDGKGHIYVLWVANQQTAYFNYSSDYGNTWQTSDHAVNTFSYLVVSTPAMTADSKGDIYVSWDGVADGKSGEKVYSNISHDYGASWQKNDFELDHTDVNTGASSSHLSADNLGHVYAVWNEDSGFSQSSLFFNHSDDFGNTWQSSDTPITNDPNTNFINPVINNYNNQVFVGFERYCGTQCTSHVYLNYSLDGGNTWLPNQVRLDNGPSGSNQTLLTGTSINYCSYFAWSDNRNNGQNGSPAHYYTVSINSNPQGSIQHTCD